jgi:hypothetical protein
MWATMLTSSRHVTSCTLIEVYCRFEWTYCLRLQDRRISWALKKLVRIYRERYFALSPIHSAVEIGPLRPLFHISVAPDLSVTPIGSFRAIIYPILHFYKTALSGATGFSLRLTCVGSFRAAIPASFIPVSVLFLPRLAYISTLKVEAACSPKCL